MGHITETHIWIAAGVVFLIVFVFAVRRERIRNREMKRQARILGFDYAEDDDDLLADTLPSLHLFKQGHSRSVSHRMRIESGTAMMLFFDFRYRVSSGQSSSNHRQSVVAFHDPEWVLPEFELRPENVFHKIGSAFGYQDIDFPSHPDFSRRYLLRGGEANAIRKLFTGPLVRFFAKRKGWSVETGGNWLIIYRHRRRPRPSDLRRFLKETEEIKRTITGS